MPEIVTLNTPDDLPAARDLIARHSGLGGHEPVIQFRVVVSPAAGTFEPATELAEGRTCGSARSSVTSRPGRGRSR